MYQIWKFGTGGFRLLRTNLFNNRLLVNFGFSKEVGTGGRGRWPLFILLGLLAVVVVAVVGLFVVNSSLESQYNGKIEPGVSISGVYVGQMTTEQAQSVLEKQLAGYSQQPVTLSFQDKNWTPTLDDLGVTIDLQSSLDKATAFGRVSGFLAGFQLLNPQTTNIPLQIQLDNNKLKSYLDTISNQINQTAVEPTIQLNSGKISVSKSQLGYKVDYDQTLQAIQKNLVSLTPAKTNLLKVDTTNPNISDTAIASLQDKLTAIISNPVTVQFNDKTWTLDSKTLASWITLTPNSSDTVNPYGISVNRDLVTAYVNDLAKGINQTAQDGKIGWHVDHVVATSPSKDGQKVNVDKSVDAILASINDPSNRTTSLAVDVVKPSIDTNNLAALGINAIVGEGVSHFGGLNDARGHNIVTAASYLTGTFIKPHEVFSFLNTIGDITADRGYWKGYSIVADQTVPDVGGGVCQVSTTTFRAAFYAGLPIVERHPHAYRVHWYEEMGEPVGFDAAVYEPGLDMKFQNPYDTWMYLEAYVSGNYLHVRLWGTKIPGQTVEMKASGAYNFVPALPDKTIVNPDLAPGQKEQLDSAQQGLSADITRIIKVNGQVVKTEDFFSRYEPWGNIYQVGPTATPKSQPTSTPAPSNTKKPSAPTTTTPAPSTTKAANSGSSKSSAPTTTPAPSTTKAG